MIAKISVGNGLRGSLKYDFAPAKDGEPRARYIGGTLEGTPREMAAQAGPLRALRPEVKNPIWRCSLSLPPSERQVSDAEWKIIAHDFLKEMGVQADISAWCAVRHSDREHDHIHISLLRIQADGKLWDRAHDVRRAIAATARLEQKYGLLSHARERPPRPPKPSQSENFSPSPTPFQPKPKKGQKMSVISKIQSEVDLVLTAAGVGGMTVAELKKRLLAKQILLQETRTKQGKVMGFRYRCDDSAWISASQIGSEYGLGLAARGVDFSEQSSPESSKAAATTKDKPIVSSQLDRLQDWLDTADPVALDPSAKPKLQAAKPTQKPNSPALPLRLSGHWHADVAIICNQIGLGLALALLSYLKRCLVEQDIKMQVEVQEALEERPWYVPRPKLGVKRLEITDAHGGQLEEERALKVDQFVAQTIASVKSGEIQNLPETTSSEAANLALEMEKEQVSNELDQIEEVQSKIRTSFPDGSEQEQAGTRSLLQILNLLLKKLLSIVQRRPVPQPYILDLNSARIEIDTAISGRTDNNHREVLANGMTYSKQVRDHYLAKTSGQLKKFMAANPTTTIVEADPLDRDDDEQESDYQPRI